MGVFEIKTYSPSDVTLSFGSYVLTGWNTISIQRNQQGFIPVRGIRGKNSRVRNKDTSATITFSCLQTGDANYVMSSIHSVDLQTGVARIALTLTDNSGDSVFSSTEAYITGFPNVVFSGDLEYYTWTIYCNTTEDTYTIGGNTRGETKIFDSAVQKISDFVSDIF